MSHKQTRSIERNQAPVAHHIARAFDDLDRLHNYVVCCQKYPLAVVWKAFKDAQNVPEAKIKKSRAAIFFYLVKQYAHQAH